MARNTAPSSTLDMGPVAYRYTPGDGHEYTWDGTGEYATVRSLAVNPATGRVRLTVAGEAIYMAGCARTASAFMDHVDRWRTARHVPLPPLE